MDHLDDLVLSFNIWDVILLADYNPATKPSSMTFFDVIGAEPEEVAKHADLQDGLKGFKEVDEEEV